MAAKAGVTKRRVSHINTSVNDVPSMSFMEGLFGDEFPEAFAAAVGSAARGTKSILDLPAELLAIISEDLSKMDLRRLRLTSKHLAMNVDLRINRIFISPARANLECLRRILDHPRYRFQVQEIVWDDAQLNEYRDLESFRDAILIGEHNTKMEIERLLQDANQDYHRYDPGAPDYEHDDYFDRDGRLTELAKGVLLRRDDQVSKDIIARNATMMSVEESYGIYQTLYQEEQRNMKTNVDSAAFQHTLAVCPNLERVTLTSEVWRPWNFQPAYLTPFYHSLPPGFRKPTEWPWFGHPPQITLAQVARRDEVMKTTISDESGSLPREFRGYSIVVSALASISTPTKISELIIYTGNETTGIGHQLFASPNADFTNTLTMARLIPLKRLKLSINSYGADHSTTASYLRSGQFHTLLSSLSHLEHLDLSPNCSPRRGDSLSIEAWVFYWADIIPADLLPRLKTFTLRNVNIFFGELLELISSMTCAQHITLDNISMDSHDGLSPTYFRLFERLWIYYEFAQVPCTRPKFTVVEPVKGGYKSRMVFEELNHYLHTEEFHINVPFEDQVEEQIRWDCGWLVDDRDLDFLQRVGVSWHVGGPEGW